jgi:hypothetical protein
MEDLVHEPNAGRLERVLIWKLYMDLPDSTGERSWMSPIHTRPASTISTSVIITKKATGMEVKRQE